MRRLLLGGVVAAMVATAGCSMLGARNFQQPIVHLQDVRVNGLGLTGGNLDVRTSGKPRSTNLCITVSTADRVSGAGNTACSFGQHGLSASTRA